MTDQTESASERPCACHPWDNPPVPCAQRYALTECLQAALRALEAKVRSLEVANKFGGETASAAIDKLAKEQQVLRADRDRLAGEVERILVQFDEAIARIKDMLEDDDGQAFKEAGKFLLRIKGRDDES